MLSIEPEQLTQEKLDTMTVTDILETVKSIKDLSVEYSKVMRIYSENMKLIRSHLQNKTLG